jgi:hypothetical protein
MASQITDSQRQRIYNATVLLIYEDDEGEKFGTGIFVTETYLLTAFHLVDDASTIVVGWTTASDEKAPIPLTFRIVSGDPDHDIALLELTGDRPPHLAYLRVGLLPPEESPELVGFLKNRAVVSYGFLAVPGLKNLAVVSYGFPPVPDGTFPHKIESHLGNERPLIERHRDASMSAETRILRVHTDRGHELPGISGAAVFNVELNCIFGVVRSRPVSEAESDVQPVYATSLCRAPLFYNIVEEDRDFERD